MNKKGIVVESGKNWAILLMHSGEYKKVKTKRRLYEGEFYSLPGTPPYKALASAAVLLVMLTFSLSFFPVSAYASFSSGLDLGINRWGCVVYVNANTPDGEQLVEGLNLWGRNIETVLPEILDRVVALEEQAGGSNDVTIDIRSAGDNSNADQPAIEKINRVLSSHHNPQANGYWEHKNYESLWRWEAAGQKIEPRNHPNNESKLEPTHKKSNAKGNKTVNRASDEVEKDQSQAEEGGPISNEGNEARQPSSDSGSKAGEKEGGHVSESKPGSDEGGHDRDDFEHKKTGNNRGSQDNSARSRK